MIFIFYIHFLDTNIVLAVILPNDESIKESKNYFNIVTHEKYFSNTAYSESKKVIDKFKTLSMKITVFIQEYLSKNLVNENTKTKHFNKIKKQFLNQYKNVEYPLNFKKRKFIKIVDDFFSENKNTIEKIIVCVDDKLILAFKKDIKDSFTELRIDLDEFSSNQLRCISVICKDNNKKQLNKMDIYKEDAILIDEAFNLTSTIIDHITFVTFDNGILKVSNEINEKFPYNVHISSPKEILQNYAII